MSVSIFWPLVKGESIFWYLLYVKRQDWLTWHWSDMNMAIVSVRMGGQEK